MDFFKGLTKPAAAASAALAPPTFITVKGVQYEQFELLGEGSYSTVFRCVRRDSAETVAIKKCTLMTSEAVQAFEKEFALMSAVRGHPNVVGCYAYEVCTESVPHQDTRLRRGYAVLEFCSTTLVSLMQAKRQRRRFFTGEEVAGIIGGTAHALLALHRLEPPVAHRDVKAENILFSGSGDAKLADFGSATTEAYLCSSAIHVSIAEADISRSTTMAYRAPEMCDLWAKRRVDERVDRWALGVLLYYIMYFEFPFDETKLSITRADPRAPSVDSGYPPLFRVILAGLLAKDPEQRMRLEDVIQKLAEAFPTAVRSAPPPTENAAPPVQPVSASMKLKAVASADSAVPTVAKNDASAAPAAAGGALFAMLSWKEAGSEANLRTPPRESHPVGSVVSASPAPTADPARPVASNGAVAVGPSRVDLFSSFDVAGGSSKPNQSTSQPGLDALFGLPATTATTTPPRSTTAPYHDMDDLFSSSS